MKDSSRSRKVGWYGEEDYLVSRLPGGCTFVVEERGDGEVDV